MFSANVAAVLWLRRRTSLRVVAGLSDPLVDRKLAPDNASAFVRLSWIEPVSREN